MAINLFIAECERRWTEPTGNPSPDQRDWLQWAREEAASLSPFEKGYPHPANDGSFNPGTVPFGGPYPDSAILS
ncbi:MAG: hypothetical protein ABSA05_03055 [Opitutaceae bacterium]|jgi:hypothetical protein